MTSRKRCLGCGCILGVARFARDRSRWDGLNTYCKPCDRARNKRYYQAHRQELLLKGRKAYVRNRSQRLSVARIWHARNREHVSEMHKKWYQAHRAQHLATSIKSQRARRARRDPSFLISCALRCRLYGVLQNKGIRKSTSTFRLVGCSLKNLKAHLESQFRPGMTWRNYGEWHIDHIVPCSYFDLSKDSEQHKCFHYTNLQPLWAEDNLRKGSRVKFKGGEQ